MSDKDGSRERGYSRTFDKQTNQNVVWLGQKHPHLGSREAKDMRHASPIHCHIGRDAGGTYSIQVVAFPSSMLPDATTSQSVLQELIAHLKTDLDDRAKSHPSPGQPPPTGPGQRTPFSRQQASFPQKGPQLPKPGDMVDAVLLEERTKKGGWRAKHVATGIAGPIQNSPDVPSEMKAGDCLTLRVQSANVREIAFRYPSAADQTKSGGKK